MGFTGVPLIDMQEVEGLAEKIVKACEETGCFRVMNHGVPTTLMSEFKAVTATIFDLPEDVKKEVSKPAITKSYSAYTPVFESSGIYDLTLPGAIDEYCDRLSLSPHQREIIVEYTKTVQELAGRIGRKIMEGTGVVGCDFFNGWSCTLRMNRYNYTPETLGSAGAILHTDAGFLTILQDDDGVNGLEILDEKTGELVSVDPVPGVSSFVVNCGDVAKAWSNKRFCNVKHQVMCRQPNVRFSMGVFILGPKDAKVDAPPELVDSEHPRCYLPFDYEEYRDLRNATKAPSDEALQLFCINRT